MQELGVPRYQDSEYFEFEKGLYWNNDDLINHTMKVALPDASLVKQMNLKHGKNQPKMRDGFNDCRAAAEGLVLA